MLFAHAVIELSWRADTTDHTGALSLLMVLLFHSLSSSCSA